MCLERLVALDPFARRLVAFGAPVGASEAIVQEIGPAGGRHARGANIDSSPNGAPLILMEGWACQLRLGPAHSRQILGFVLPGETVGSFWRQPEFSFFEVKTLTRATTASAAPLLAETAAGEPRYPELLGAARRAEDFSRHLFVDHIARLAERDAYAGLAHLLLELHLRLSRVGLARGGEFHLPIGQRVLARTMGFSVAHTNQTLQRMAGDGLFAMAGSTIRLLQLSRMEQLADFNPQERTPERLTASRGLQYA